jgi:lipoate-protein ligase B
MAQTCYPLGKTDRDRHLPGRIASMETITVSAEELKKLMREAFVDVLTERKDLIEGAVIEAIQDIGLAMAMEEGRTGEYVDADEFVLKLEGKIKGSK